MEALGRALFSHVSAEFLKHYLLYTTDHRTMVDQVRVLDRHFGAMPIGAVGRTEIEAFFATRLKAGKSGATCNRQLSALCTLFADFIERPRLTTLLQVTLCGLEARHSVEFVGPDLAALLQPE